MPRVALIPTLLTLVAFAANSLLCRAALGPRLIDAAGFTAIRIASGAMLLCLLVGRRGDVRSFGSWRGAAALTGYAFLFSWAYMRIPAGVGALVMFAAVQLTMFAWAAREGHRPTGRQAVGAGVALAGLAWLTLPGSEAPDLLGTLLMVASGVGWGAYSLIGRGSSRPVADTAGNFVRALVPVLLIAGAAMLVSPPRATPAGVLLAVASGALASGLGYVCWYTVLPQLGAARAAVIQLAVPVLASFGGIALLGEVLTVRLVIASVAVLGGVALATFRGARGSPR